jgi:hypothetical protein
MGFLKNFFKSKSKKSGIDYDTYKLTYNTPDNKSLESVFTSEADKLQAMADFYRTRDLKKADPLFLIRERHMLEEICKRLQNAAIDYAFSNHEDSHPDYEKALVYGNAVLNKIEKALAYQMKRF